MGRQRQQARATRAGWGAEGRGWMDEWMAHVRDCHGTVTGSVHHDRSSLWLARGVGDSCFRW